MQALIDRVVAATGLPENRARRAVGMTLFLIRKEGNQKKVDELFAKLPGAQELAVENGDEAGRGGGFLGALGGMMGGPLAAVSKLKAAGLSMSEIKALGTEVLAYAREKAGPEIVREVASSIPGLSGYA